MMEPRAFLELWLQTQNAYEFVKDGNNVITPFKFTLKIGITEMGGMSESQIAEYIYALIGPTVSSSVGTVRLGQTRADVEQIMGSPDRIVDLGPKAIYIYKSLKITFVDGKVADVE